MNDDVRTASGGIARGYLTGKGMTWDKFNKDAGFAHLTEEQKLEFWNLSHDNTGDDSKDSARSGESNSVV